MLGVFSAMEVAASGLSAERTRMNTVASNLANARTTRTAEGGPYKRIDPVFQAVPLQERVDEVRRNSTPGGVYLVEVPYIKQDDKEPQLIYDPNHPDADARGYVSLPNVNVVEEMVNLIT